MDHSTAFKAGNGSTHLLIKKIGACVRTNLILLHSGDMP